MPEPLCATQPCEALLASLRCPNCGGGVEMLSGGAICEACAVQYDCTSNGTLDLRLRSPKLCSIEFEIGRPGPDDGSVDYAPLRPHPRPAVDFGAVTVPKHMTSELLSYFPKGRSPQSLALDLGCGSTIHRGVCEHAGFTYVGLDFANPQAPLWGDAHALPFADDSFELIISVAVLEHIRYPFVTMREAFRVLKPGGLFLGTVAFLEPYHSRSYYHHSHLGVLNSLQFGGFQVKHIAPSESWDVLQAQAKVLFPGMPRRIAKPLVRGFKLLNRLWCRAAQASRMNGAERHACYVRTTTGAFKFVAWKFGGGNYT